MLSPISQLKKQVTMIKKTILFMLLFTIQNIIIGQNNKLDNVQDFQDFVSKAKKGKWKQVRNKKGVSLHYRSLSLFDEIETRQMSAKFQVSSNLLDTIITQIKEPENIKLWNESIREVKLLKNDATNWILHSVYKIPFPFAQQDLVASYLLTKKRDTLILSSKSLPKYIKEKKGVTRESYNLSQWLLIRRDNGEIDVEFSAISLSNSTIPRFIKDPIIQRKLLKSFIKLKERLQ